MGNNHSHFNSKEAVEHVAEMQAKGIVDATEIHGTEIPGHISAATDSAKETALAISIIWLLLTKMSLSHLDIFYSLLTFSIAWLIWKSGRSAWLGWSRLERLHRIVAQEKWEIDHHREQEREELTALYNAKGFEGKLLEDVIDTLMADNNRLLKVMIEEELGLSLESQEHPLKQGLGAAMGVLVSSLICGIGFYFNPNYGLILASLFTIAIASVLFSCYEKNKIIQAVFWNMGIAIFSLGTVYYIQQFIYAV